MKTGTCENCGRKDIKIMAKGLCGTCYQAARGLEDEERQKALAKVRERILAKERKDIEDRCDEIQSKRAERAASEAQEAIREARDGKKITIVFQGPDIEIYKALETAAGINCRMIESEAITILESGLQDIIFKTGKGCAAISEGTR